MTKKYCNFIVMFGEYILRKIINVIINCRSNIHYAKRFLLSTYYSFFGRITLSYQYKNTKFENITISIFPASYGESIYMRKILDGPNTKNIIYFGNIQDKINIPYEISHYRLKMYPCIFYKNDKVVAINKTEFDNYVRLMKYIKNPISNLGIILSGLGYDCTDLILYSKNKPHEKTNVNSIDIQEIYENLEQTT